MLVAVPAVVDNASGRSLFAISAQGFQGQSGSGQNDARIIERFCLHGPRVLNRLGLPLFIPSLQQVLALPYNSPYFIVLKHV